MPRTTVAQGGRADAVFAGVLIALSLFALILPPRLREPVAAGVRRTVGAPLLVLQERAERSRAAFVAHDSTNRVLDSLALASMDVTALRAENERLRAMLGLGTRLRWGFLTADANFLPAEKGFIPGSAIGDPDAARSATIAISVGSRAGVIPYAPVVAPGGLVGRVRSVDPNTSLVELYFHENFRASAMTADQSVVGIVRPHLGDTDDEHLLEMSGVLLRTQLEPGTVIYTSGLGGTFPAYIPIGTVIEEIESTGLSARTYLLRPLVRPGAIRSVVVLLPDRAQAGVEGVWITAPDSALEALVQAGDSAVRDSVRADSLARVQALRQRLLDSLRAAGVPLVPGDTAAAAPPAAVPLPRPRPATGGGEAGRPPRPDSALAPPPGQPSTDPSHAAPRTR